MTTGTRIGFDTAARYHGYDPFSPSDAAAARADYRVWDLVGEPVNPYEIDPFTSALDNLLDSACGKVRVARKPWRCTCADEVRQWKVQASYTSDNGGGCTTSTLRTEAEAHEVAARKLGAVACWNVNVDPAVPSGYYDKVEVEPRPNPNYRPDCLGDIAVGDRHFEYLGDTAAYQSGTRYCARCAVAVWGRDG